MTELLANTFNTARAPIPHAFPGSPPAGFAEPRSMAPPRSLAGRDLYGAAATSDGTFAYAAGGYSFSLANNSGTANTLSAAQYSLKSNTTLINQVNPGVFSYWVKVTAPAGNNTFVINQTITTGNFNTLFSIASGSNVFGANCVNGLNPTFTQSSTNGTSGTVAVANAPSAGTYYIFIKLDSTIVKGKTGPTPTTVHYAFSTVGVPGSTSGLDLVKKPTGNAAISPSGAVSSAYTLLANLLYRNGR
jgi:hypothetical protein